MRYRSLSEVIFNCLICIGCFYVGFIMKSYFCDNEIQPTNAEIIVEKNPIDISKDSIDHYKRTMKTFESGLRSCLGDYCFNARPDGYAYDRVGILSPPDSGGESITQALTNWVNKNKKLSQSTELVYSTNVPAYGYGKNHGWSRIIRLVRKVVPHAYSILSRFDNDIITEEKYELQVT